MSHLTVFAHFCYGKPNDIFPKGISGIPGEGAIFPHPLLKDDGGVLTLCYSTSDLDLVVDSVKEHLKDNGLTLLVVHRHGEKKACYTEAAESIW